MKIFIDDSISPRLAEALQILDHRHQIVHLRSKFSTDTRDVDWLRVLGQEGDWIIVAADPRISKSKAEQRVWREAGLTAFFFGKGWASMRYWKQVEDLVHWWPKIIEEAGKGTPGTGYLMLARAKEFKQLYAP